MADPKFNQIGAKFVTMKTDSSISYVKTAANGSADVGKVVMLVGQGTVGLADDDAVIFGKLVKVESDDVAVIQYKGFCEVPTTGVITYDQANNGLVGSGTDGVAKASTSAATSCAAIQNEDTDVTMALLN